MIRRSSERIIDKPQRKFGAPGFITVRNLINEPEELNSKGRVSGKGEYNDNGTVTTIEAGDVTFCPAGTGHGVLCVGDEPLELIALILYE